ncbi:MAG: RNA repair domain-containing protein, partial [Microcoleus sp.]
MATSREIIDRLFWDVRLNRHVFVVGFQDRQSAGRFLEKSLVEWMNQSDIPEHRVRYIRCGDSIVWDRESRLDLVSAGQLPDAAWMISETEPVLLGFELRSIYVCGDREDKQVLLTSPSQPVSISHLKVVSFNVLCDAYEPEGTPTQQRLAEVVRQLQQCDADIMAIQEASPAFLSCLLARDWMRGYFVSEILPGESLNPYGLFICSRYPFTLVEYRHSKHKRAFVATWEFAAEDAGIKNIENNKGSRTENQIENRRNQQFRVATVHLPSNGAQNAANLRSQQLKELLDYLQTQPGDCLLVGDFNAGETELDGLLEPEWLDLWRHLHPNEPGFTFDTDRNSLAACSSRSGQPHRYDRILLRSPDSSGEFSWQPRSIELFACEPIANINTANPNTNKILYSSDHFGLKASLEMQYQKAAEKDKNEGFRKVSESANLADFAIKQPTYRSAIVIIPPVELQPPIQAIRRQFDRSFVRWMPHINLIYGFLPEADFEAAVTAMASVLAQIPPFEVTLAGYQTFEHRRNCTAWLEPIPEPKQALHELQAALESLFPQCSEQGQKSTAGFTPHLSVGQFNSPAAAFAALPSWQPLRFRVESVALISRREDEPFEVRYLVKLGGGNLLENPPDGSPFSVTNSASDRTLIEIVSQLEPDLSPTQQSHRQTVRDLVMQACSECLGYEAYLHSIGSARLGTETAASDLDVLCAIPTSMSGEAFLMQVQQGLQGFYDSAQVVHGRVSALRMEIDRVAIDLLYARAPSGLLHGSI